MEDYPAILQYLTSYKERLMPKPKGHSGIWGGRKEGTYQWYEIQDAVDYYEEFTNPKILYQEIMTFQSFTYEETGLYTNNKIFFITNPEKHLVALINSKPIWLYLKQVASKLQGGALAMQSPIVLSIPIPKMNKTESKALDLLADRILAAKQTDPKSDTTVLESEVDALVYGLYGLTEEEIAIVEGT